MSNVFGISVTALQAFQAAISVTGNNIANANTPGYSRESINLTAGAPQSNGTASVGSGVVVSGVARSFSQATANQLNSSQSSLGQLNALQTYSGQIDNLFGTHAGGLSTALQGFYNSWSDVANAPTSTATRQALLGKAQSVAASFQSTSSQLDALNVDINSRITADVQQINGLAASISTLNAQIVIATAQGGSQAPNTLIDRRDQLVSNLSTLTGVSTTTDSNGSLNVFLGNGQPLVLQGNVSPLAIASNPFNASQLEVSSGGSSGIVSSSGLTSGDLGGLFAARDQVVNPARNQLGQIATAFAAAANSQQNAGLDLTGKLGANLFAVDAPSVTASARNTGGATAAVGLANIGALTANDYVLTYRGGAYSLANAADGSAVPSTGNGTAASPLSADGLSIVLSQTPAQGDQFLIQPTTQAGGSLSVVLKDPGAVAAAGAVLASAAGANTGTGTITSGSVVDAANPNLLTTATLQFTSVTTYSINGAGSYAYTAGGSISQNGWQVAISGVPSTGDTFVVRGNSSGGGDNRNALLSAAQQTLPVLGNGTVSINGATSALVTGIGSQAQQINTAQAAQSAVNSQAVANSQAISGVNLDEEAANLLRWQQAYGAAAKALQIGSTLFQTLLTAVNAA